jgi:hypothetical protein
MRTRMRSESVVRRRVCDSCGHRFNTTETIVLESRGQQALRKGATIDREFDEDFDRRARRVGYRADRAFVHCTKLAQPARRTEILSTSVSPVNTRPPAPSALGFALSRSCTAVTPRDKPQ